jgi:hypothetical protein
MANSKRFPGKFTGAKARLFAYVCEYYSAEMEVDEEGLESNEKAHEKPDAHPIFIWLSPHQRLQLVREVMVGLLCPDEPLPPETIQHYATYLALVATIRIGIEVEIDTFRFEEISDDLLDDYRYGYNDTDDYKERTPEENEECILYTELLFRQAEKGRENINRSLAGTDARPVEEFQAPALNRLDAA